MSGISLLILGGINFRKKRLHNYSFEIFTAICLFGIGIGSIVLDHGKKPTDHYSLVPEKPEVIRLKIQEELRSGTYNNRYIAGVLTVNNSPARGKILLYTSDSVSLPPDTELLVFKSWNAIRPPLNPGQFDYRRYMERQMIYDEIRLGDSGSVILGVLDPTLLGQLRMLRENIGSRLFEVGLSPSTVATTEAILLGERQHLDTNLYDAYKDAGAVHILAVSGLHIGILVLILKFLLQSIRRLRHGDIIQFLIIILLLWVYALFTGMSPSVVRAVTLFSFIGYAWMIRRPVNMYNTLALSFFFILLILHPTHLFQPGFQMSYAAVLSIIWIYPKLMKVWRPRNEFFKRFWQIMAVSISAQLGVLPISLYYFHQFPGLFFISNLLILPFLGIVLGMGILVILLVQLDWNLPHIYSAYDALIQTMNSVVEWIGSQDVFVFREVAFDLPRLVLLYGLIIAVISFLERRRFKPLIVLSALSMLFQSWVIFRNGNLQKQESLYIMHAFAETMLLEHSGSSIMLHANSSYSKMDRIIQDYQMAMGKGEISRESLHNSYHWGENRILIIDGSGIVPASRIATHILLSQSPRIHLDRILQAYPTATIIADGSNYPSFVRRWQESCSKHNRSFHYTGEDGAYRFVSK